MLPGTTSKTYQNTSKWSKMNKDNEIESTNVCLLSGEKSHSTLMCILTVHTPTPSHKYTYTPTCTKVIRGKHLSLCAIKWSCSLFVEFSGTLQKKQSTSKETNSTTPVLVLFFLKVQYDRVHFCFSVLFYLFIFLFQKTCHSHPSKPEPCVQKVDYPIEKS